MFIIFGTPRSGTTLLKEALCQHTEIVIPHETDFIVPLALLLDRVPDSTVGRRLAFEMIIATRDFAHSIGRYLTPSDVESIIYSTNYSLPAIISAIYAALAFKTGKSIAGDKSPNDLAFVRILAKAGLFDSDIKIIHLVRDVRDVVLSLQSTAWAPTEVETYFPRVWTSANLNLRHFATRILDRYLFLRYEDFVWNSEQKLEEISHFLGVPFDLKMLNWEQMGTELKHLAHHQNLGRSPLSEKCYGWKQRIPELRHQFEQWTRQAEDALCEFGYEVAI
jgi:hypothetical protein